MKVISNVWVKESTKGNEIGWSLKIQCYKLYFKHRSEECKILNDSCVIFTEWNPSMLAKAGANPANVYKRPTYGNHVISWKLNHEISARVSEHCTVQIPAVKLGSECSFLSVAPQPLVGQGLLFFVASRSHLDTPDSVRFPPGRVISPTNLTTHNSNKIQSSIYPAGFEPAIPAREWPLVEKDGGGSGKLEFC